MKTPKKYTQARAFAVLATGYLAGVLAYPYLPGPFLEQRPSARILVAFTLPTTALVIYSLFSQPLEPRPDSQRQRSLRAHVSGDRPAGAVVRRRPSRARDDRAYRCDGCRRPPCLNGPRRCRASRCGHDRDREPVASHAAERRRRCPHQPDADERAALATGASRRRLCDRRARDRHRDHRSLSDAQVLGAVVSAAALCAVLTVVVSYRKYRARLTGRVTRPFPQCSKFER